ncbi:MAG: 2-oxoacid:ferredoxin oxidoreductase subunit beta, partial [Candidatus Aerophobetes bacterium]|nr:2-oxoacid:ferredoxin oxidoreductase subunit beta [Candidatus Aerophobetes bacterium]
MAKVFEYIRLDRLPHAWCPGCGIGIVMGSIIRAVDKMELNKNDVVMVSGIGCSGRMSGYCDFNTLHTTHGRALSFATGIKLANPKFKVIAVMGDGDALAIGGNHLIHTARRNIDILAIIINNWIYGMTGGQYSPTTPLGSFATTTPYGQVEPPFDVLKLIKGSGASYIARGTVYHTRELDKLILRGIQKRGFAVVEVISQCPTSFGRRNKMGSTVEMMKWQKEHTVSVKKAEKMSQEELKDKVIRGLFLNEERAEYTKEYEKLIVKAKGGVKSEKNI